MRDARRAGTYDASSVTPSIVSGTYQNRDGCDYALNVLCLRGAAGSLTQQELDATAN